VKRRQKTTPLGAVFGSPFHHTPTRASGRFALFLGLCCGKRQRALPPQTPLLTFRHPLSLTLPTSPPFPRGTYFGSTSSVPKMDSSPSTLRIMARGIYGTVLPTALRLCLPVHHRPLSSGVYSLFRWTHASSHGRTTITAPPCPSSSTLDRTRVP
jgi:hypothetical protein